MFSAPEDPDSSAAAFFEDEDSSFGAVEGATSETSTVDEEAAKTKEGCVPALSAAEELSLIHI